MRRLKSPRAYARFSWLACLACATAAAAETPPCEDWAQIVSLQGATEARRADSAEWHRARLHDYFCPGDTVRVLRRGRAALLLRGETIVRLDQLSALTLLASREPGRRWLDLLSGIAHFISRVPRSLDVKTPYVNAAIEGTEFLLRIGADQTLLAVYEGTVRASNAAGEARVGAGETIAVTRGHAPAPYALVRPRDAVQWTIYYPPLVYYRPEQLADRPAMRHALDAQRRGDIDAAVEALSGSDDPRVLTYRAALQLSVGRTDTARADLERTLARAPDDADARALLSMMATASDDRERALQLAQEAVTATPQSPMALLALSYASQALFDLEAARDAAERATRLDPANAVAWARLAELQLSMGDTRRALAAASEASVREPSLARAQSVLGFAYVTQFKTVDARHAFETAIALDSSDPLPRLGLGLVKIREGNLADGRLQIEIAASLDPGNALVRSYLGKAYYDEKRNALASDQYTMAKAIDARDPTPWFYSAIQKQTENRPIEALHDLQQSIERNDNRAVYRSRLLLDQDFAARNVSAARIYTDLGFPSLALLDGWKSVAAEPANHSAHRFLVDAYATQPRHEIARVSELLQAQMLQPLNLNPLPIELGEANLAIVEDTGPKDIGLNEFTPLFVRNRVALLVGGTAGSNNTRGNEIVVAGLHDRLSYSIGQYRYETDGFRANNDLTHDIYNAFAQLSLSPSLTLQVEGRRRETRFGDLDFRFDPLNFFPNNRRDIDADSARLGVRYSPSSDTNLLVSFIAGNRNDKTHTKIIFDPDFYATDEVTTDSDSRLAEAQYIKSGRNNAIFGIGKYNKIGTRRTLYQEFEFDVLAYEERETLARDADHANAYAYANWDGPGKTWWTFGLSHDDFANGQVVRDQYNPKLGVVWMPVPGTTLRAAGFRTLKRSLASNQTLEPTQVTGFNQFFDDPDGTDADRYGIAWDQRLSSTLNTGLETSRRALKVPFADQTDDQQEQQARAYLYWTSRSSYTASLNYTYDDFERDQPRRTVPYTLTTRTVPMRVSYFAPSGLFSSLTLTAVQQDVEFIQSTGTGFTVVSAREHFATLDWELGYRFLKHGGSVAFLVKNAFDEEFRYQDQNFQSVEKTAPTFLPERTVYLNLMLLF